MDIIEFATKRLGRELNFYEREILLAFAEERLGLSKPGAREFAERAKEIVEEWLVSYEAALAGAPGQRR